MMELDNKSRKKILHTLLNERRPEGRLLDFFREKREMLIAIPAGSDENDTKAAYKERLSNLLRLGQSLHETLCMKPLNQCHLKQIERAKLLLQVLKHDVQTGLIDLAAIKPEHYKEWGGAGLIVTTIPDRRHGSSILVFHEKAHVLVWLTHRLQWICGSSLDYLNKDEFYAKVGLEAKQYLDGCIAQDRSPDTRTWCIEVIDGVDGLMKKWMENLSGNS
ncbi:MAG: hypothetical protein RI542_07920 [Wenzhouxiangella sp.]|nr:hypothetical protein [Wenzhouxiangella sp.]